MSPQALNPRELAGEVSSLFSLPDLVLRALAVLDSHTASTQDLIEVIEFDANLAVTVLRLANSAMYAGRGHVQNLTQAVPLIGQNAVRDLVLASAAVQTFRDIPEEFVDMNTFWDNSATAAVLARLIASQVGLRDGEGLFLAGLLQGVGRLVLYVRRPEQYRKVIRLAAADDANLAACEREIFGFDQAEVGAALLENWGLPEKLTMPVRHHPDPAAAPAFPREVAVIRLAADLATHQAPCRKTGWEPDSLLPENLATDSMELLCLNPADLKEISLEAIAASQELIEIINPCTHHIHY